MNLTIRIDKDLKEAIKRAHIAAIREWDKEQSARMPSQADVVRLILRRGLRGGK